VVLSCGLIVAVSSSLPSLRLFGWLSTVAMMLALVADLTILRPLITFLRSTFQRARL
jgi:predicted RND superfamily exporter protein